jgi:hypothetical protein
MIVVTIGGAVWRGSGMANNNSLRTGFGSAPIPALGQAISMLRGLSTMLGYAQPSPPPPSAASLAAQGVQEVAPRPDPRTVRQAMLPGVAGPTGQTYAPTVANTPPAGNGTDKGPDLTKIPPDLLKMLPSGLVVTNAQGKPELTAAGRVALQQVAGVGQTNTPGGNGQLQAVAKALRGQ